MQKGKDTRMQGKNTENSRKFIHNHQNESDLKKI